MSILPINSDLSSCSPFCDYLNITSPKLNHEGILALIKPYLDVMGCLEEFEGTYKLSGGFGTFKVYVRGSVVVFSASGGFLNTLRGINMFDSYLMIFTDFPHRISMLHATCDFRVDAPEYIQQTYNLATSGNFYLTRKATEPKNVSRLVSRNQDGVDTGTVYIGNKANSDVWAKVYDKRQERIQKGFADPLPLLRIEIAIQSDIGASLKDASNPHDIFYYFAQKSLVIPPKSFKGWVSYGAGFETDKPSQDLTTWQRIWGIIDNSNDFKRVIDLAIADYGDDALKEIQKLVAKRLTLRKGLQAA